MSNKPYIYIASSWRNPLQIDVVRSLRHAGVDHYDFRHPAPGEHGFAWSEIDPNWERWTPTQWREALNHPLAVNGFHRDMEALRRCDACLLVLPCGRSAHLELGWAVGAAKWSAILAIEPTEPDLMVSMCDQFFTRIEAAVEWCASIRPESR